MKKSIYDPAYVRIIESLKQRRLDRGLTQAQVAQKLGRARTWVNKLEQCERRLDVVELRDLCALYGIDFHEVVATITEEDP